VAISQRCTPAGDATLLGAGGTVGLVDGHLLVAEARWAGGDAPFSMYARWYDRDFAPETDPFWLGDGGRIAPADWVAFDHRLYAQIWVTTATPLPPVRESIAVYALVPGSTDFTRTAVDLPILGAWGDDPRWADVLTGWTPGGDASARATGAVGNGVPVFALTALPTSCADFAFANAQRLMLFSTDAHYLHQFGDDPCSAVRGGFADFAHTSTLVSLYDGGLGMFFRLGRNLGEGRLWYSRIGPDLRVLDQPPVLVGGLGRPSGTVGAGYQADAAALGSGTLLFTSRNEESMSNLCSDLGVVEPDGRNPRGAPWQLPCVPPANAAERGLFAPWVNASIEIEPLEGGHAVVVYGERTNVAFALVHPTLTSDVAWEEGVYLTTVDELGRRSSEIITVSPPEATAVLAAGTPRTATTGPIAGDFEVQAVAEGDDVVIVWRDNRPDAPGYYARRYTCGPIAAE
jgi:hypothetical protein